MIANFFQSLDREGVAYLLISGQATVLYGAAAFSEDIDLWIDPTQENAAAFLRALSTQGARYYKLTPPMDAEFLLRGHGFHFLVPDDPEFYLDVMGRPPRVPPFDEAVAAAKIIPTAWGDLPTVGIRHLVGLKTTQRLSDYPIIGRLVLRYMEGRRRPTHEDYAWAVEHVYTTEDLAELLVSFPGAAKACLGSPVLRRFADEVCRDGEASSRARRAAERWLNARMLAAREADRNYWAEIIGDLRELRRRNRLMPVGQLVVPA
jgi:hypothetical protein